MSLKDLISSDVDRVLMNDRDFAETIVLHSSPFKCEVQALVSLSDGQQETGQGRRQVAQGEVHVAEKDALEITNLIKLTIRGRLFHITSIDLPVGGMVKIEVTRSDREHTNTSALDPL